MWIEVGIESFPERLDSFPTAFLLKAKTERNNTTTTLNINNSEENATSTTSKSAKTQARI
jgi:hypothetical protein